MQPSLPLGPDSLARLLARSADGDESAFATLYDATSSRTYGLALRLVRDHALAEEVAQETYLQVWQTAARFDEGRGSAMAWLMTMAHRRAVDMIRATEAHRRLDAHYLDGYSAIDGDVTVVTVETSIEARRVRTALASLRPIQRQVLELAYFGGRTHSEIARITGIPLGTAKTRIRDGLINLRDSLSA